MRLLMMLDMVSHNPRSAPVLGAAFRCGSQLESWSWSWRGTQCFGGLPNLIATLRFVSGSLSKRDWAFAGGEGGPGLSLARSFSLLLGESRRAFATIFACRISLLIGYMTCQLRLGQRRGKMDSRMQDMVLHGVPPFPISLALFLFSYFPCSLAFPLRHILHSIQDSTNSSYSFYSPFFCYSSFYSYFSFTSPAPPEEVLLLCRVFRPRFRLVCFVC